MVRAPAAWPWSLALALLVGLAASPAPARAERAERAGASRKSGKRPARPRRPKPGVVIVQPEGGESAQGSAAPGPGSAAIPVVIYTTTWCPYCKKAKEHLRRRGVEFTEYEIEADPERERERLEKAGGSKGVPVIDVDGTIIKGFGAESIDDALAAARRRREG